jgi:hypothetical protein
VSLKNLALYIASWILIFAPLVAQKDTVIFIPAGGNHVGLEQIRVQIPEGFSVYYTTDGRSPSKYSARVKNAISLRGNTTFRFAIYDAKNNRREEVHSYFTERKHMVPIVSIVGDPDDFFDSVRGIYAKGCCADTVNPYMGANFWKDWERKINVEFFEPSGETGFNQPAGIKIFGGYSVANPQKSFALYARKKYGVKKFKHEIFPQLEFKKYNNFILRNAGGDMFGAHIRDVFATQLLKPTGLAIQEYRPVAVYINGAYWGKYNIREKINEHYINAHYKIPKDSLMIMRHNGDRQHGPGVDYRSFIAKMPKLDLNKPEDLKKVDAWMDIENYMLYNAAEIYTANGDAGGNIRYYKSMQQGGKWRWIFYDLDIGMNINGSKEYLIPSVHDFTTLKNEIWPNPPWSTLIIRKLLENDSLKYCYINQFSDLLNTALHPAVGKKLLDSLVREVEDEIIYHKKRWKITDARYSKSVSDIYLFVEKRPEALRSQLMERFNLSKTSKIRVIIPSVGGYVKLNTLRLKENFEGVYFQDVPIHFSAHPEYDYEFVGWKNLTNEARKSYYLLTSDELVLEPIFKRKEYSPFKGLVVITEIDATQEKKKQSNDWIELYNNTSQPISLNKWTLKDGKDKHTFTFGNFKIQPNEHLIITQDSAIFAEQYPKSIQVIGNIPFGFNKSTDKIRLYDQNGLTVDEFDLAVFGLTEPDSLNWARLDYRKAGFIIDNWVFEHPTPGTQSLAFTMLIEQEKNDDFWKSVFFYVGISAGVVLILLFLVPLWRKQQNKKQTQ